MKPERWGTSTAWACADAQMVAYSQEKVASVRRLQRTSLPIPHAGGTYPPKPLIPILGGLLTFESNWSPALGRHSSRPC